MYYLTSPVNYFNNIPTNFTDWTGGLANSTSLFAMPSTCTYESYVQNGYCSLQYSGLSYLLGIDVNLRLRVRSCSSGALEIFLGCKGGDCFLFNSYKLCSSNSDCTQTTVCSNFLNDTGNAITEIMNSNNNSANNSDNNGINNNSPGISMVFGNESVPTNNTSTSSNSGFTWSKFNEQLNVIRFITPALFYDIFQPNTQCFSTPNQELSLDFKNFLLVLQGTPAVNNTNNVTTSNSTTVNSTSSNSTSSNSAAYTCSFDPRYLQNLTTDFSNQLTASGNVVTLQGLAAWDVGGNPLSIVFTNTNIESANGAITMIISVVTLMIAFFI